MKIKMLLDEDFYAEEQMKLSLDKRKELGRKWLNFHFFVKKKLLDTGKVSRITFLRWDKVLWKRYGFMKHEYMLPSEYNKKYGIKPINMKYFKNAEKKIKFELDKLKEVAT